MAYSGLSAHEIRGLRNDDYDGNYLTIQPYDDRRTKSINRIRNVIAHKEKLKPHLEAYLKNKRESIYLFPSVTIGSEQWTVDIFSKHLNKIIKTDKMNALSLRRTFGSLLLKSGKTEAEIAAAMGNSAIMVRKHYAKILACEIDIDF